MKKILLISNRVMHYRVSVYNYFVERFRNQDYTFMVRANELQKESPYPIRFDFKELPFSFSVYRDEIKKIGPDTVILFLHLKNLLIFPLIYWLKWKRIPVIFWTKGANLDDPHNRLRNMLFHHLHNLSDGIILYSKNERSFVKNKNHKKITYANNTINYYDYANITETKEEIKKQLNIRFRKVALFVGRMDAAERGRKKVAHAIEIFKTIDSPDYGLILVGSGLGEELRRSMNQKNTIYLGEVHDPKNIQISRIFTMADVFLMPGHVGLSLNQAFYWSLPVLTEEGEQPPEIHYLVNGQNGYIVKEDDVVSLKEKLLYLFENEQECKRLGENAKYDLLENASIEGMFQGFLDNIKKLTIVP